MAIDNVLDLLQERYGKKKTARKIFILTAGGGESEYMRKHIPHLARRVVTESVKINIM